MIRSILPVLAVAGIGFLAMWLDNPAQPDGSAQPVASGMSEMLSHLVVTGAMAQEQDHGFLIDVHANAGISCDGCHGGAAFTEPVPDSVCTDCHGNLAEMAALTPWEPNPHASHLGEIPCTTCHKIHTESVSFCDACHSFGMVVP